MDPQRILSAAECERERTPDELAEWVKEKNALFSSTKEGQDYVAARKGLARKFIDEIYPLSLLAQHLFYDRVDVVCKPEFDDAGFDALVIDYRDRPLKAHKLVFARAIYRYHQYLHTFYARQPGANTSPRNKVDGRGKGATAQQWQIDLEKASAQGFKLVARAARSKVSKPHGPDTSLVIVFDDHWLAQIPEALTKMAEYVEATVLPMELDFSKLFLVGWSGKMLLGFALTGQSVVSGT
ncbi:MAG: hypothetical protein ACE5K1_06780 [Acidiferrobacterales bacterium]